MNTTMPITASPLFSTPTPLDFDATLVNGSKPTLTGAAREMETMFLSMLMKQMRESSDPDGEGMFPGDTGDVYGGLFDFYMSKHLSEAGGIGLGASLANQLDQQQTKESHPNGSIPIGAAARASLYRPSGI